MYNIVDCWLSHSQVNKYQQYVFSNTVRFGLVAYAGIQSAPLKGQRFILAANSYLLRKDIGGNRCPEERVTSHSLCVSCNLSFSVFCFGSRAGRLPHFLRMSSLYVGFGLKGVDRFCFYKQNSFPCHWVQGKLKFNIQDTSVKIRNFHNTNTVILCGLWIY